MARKASVQLEIFLEGSLRFFEGGNLAILSMRLDESTVRASTTQKVSRRREEETAAGHSDEQRRLLLFDEQIGIRDGNLILQLAGSPISGVVM